MITFGSYFYVNQSAVSRNLRGNESLQPLYRNISGCITWTGLRSGDCLAEAHVPDDRAARAAVSLAQNGVSFAYQPGWPDDTASRVVQLMDHLRVLDECTPNPDTAVVVTADETQELRGRAIKNRVKELVREEKPFIFTTQSGTLALEAPQLKAISAAFNTQA